MPNSVTTAFVEQYRDDFILLSQQLEPKFRGTTRETFIVGDQAYFERLGETDPIQSTVRHGVTQHVNPEYTRRSVVPQDWYWSALIDDEDRFKMLAMPDNDYLRMAVASLNRKCDDIIIEALGGSARSGHTGGSTTALPSGQKIAHGSAGMSLAKITEARKILLDADINMDDKLYLAMSPYQMDELLQLEKFTSGDYGYQNLREGTLDYFAGFNILITTRLPASVAGRYCYAWAMEGMGLAVAKDLEVRIDELATHRYATQVFVRKSLGAVRVEDEKVIQIDCQET